MKQQLVAAIRDQHLWTPGMSVAVAVSGGLDSMVLLHLLHATRGLHRADLSVVYVDHQQHPDSSSWGLAVAEFAERLELPVSIHKVNLNTGASEAEARDARFGVFSSLEVDRVALAHHRRDQAETVLINLLRGTGGRGLAGMSWRRDRYVRPLLATCHADLVSWAERFGVGFVQDPSNRSEAFLRNRVRHKLLPMLEDVRQGAVATLARSASLAADDEACLRTLADQLSLEVEVLKRAPVALSRRRIRSLLPSAGTAQIEAVLAIIQRGKGRVMVGEGAAVVIRHHRVVMEGDFEGFAG